MRLLVAVVLAVVTLLPVGARAQDAWSDPFPGVRHLHRRSSTQNIHVLVVDLCASGVSVRATADAERRRTPSSFGALVGAEAVVNGDFFSYSNYSTNGPSMSGGVAWGGSDHDYVTPIAFGDGRVSMPPHEGTGGLEPWMREVVSGHPTILQGGAVRDSSDTLCTARHPRTAAGLSADRRTLYLAVVDGRATGRVGMRCDELAILLRDLGAHDATNLDGGGSSAMWLRGSGVANYPSDGSERVVANHLAVHATGSGAAAHCPLPEYAATLVGQDHPAEMISGERAVAWVEYRNDGRATWSIDRTRLGTTDPDDHPSPFYDVENWIDDHRASGADHSNYGPGATGRFSFMITAPEVTEETTVTDTFRLVEEGVTWFGDPVTISVRVRPRVAPTPDGGTAPADDGGVPSDDDAGTARDGGDAPDAGTTSRDAGARPTSSRIVGGCTVAHGRGGGALISLALLALGLVIRRGPRGRYRA